ncbi:hypothetical protein [Streptosporangium canum]|uniref:hypothetical protein n=1 Tax=Streptosporangium canum TaxID=324952 RepID=UPI0015A5A0CD|nr:hypothetical protein [Streptosporangium canum]
MDDVVALRARYDRVEGAVVDQERVVAGLGPVAVVEVEGEVVVDADRAMAAGILVAVRLPAHQR